LVDVRLAQVVAGVFQLDSREISPELGIGAIEGWDSLGHLNLVLRLEDAFGIRFTTEEIPQLTSVEQIQKSLVEKGAI